MSSSCLVSYATEERHYAQEMYYNRKTNPNGGFIDQPGMAIRDVVETTTLYRGTHNDVETAILAAARAQTPTANKTVAYELHKSDGPWWEGTFTIVEYGDWEDSEDYFDPTQNT